MFKDWEILWSGITTFNMEAKSNIIINCSFTVFNLFWFMWSDLFVLLMLPKRIDDPFCQR